MEDHPTLRRIMKNKNVLIMEICQCGNLEAKINIVKSQYNYNSESRGLRFLSHL